MLDIPISLLARYLLFSTNETFIIALIIIGYLSEFKAVFAKATIIMLFTMILNTYLKSIWKIPLNPSLGKEGWAFPSGHMQNFVVFYGYLALHFRNKIILTAFFILTHLVAFSLVYLNYHSYYDVLAAGYFGILTIICFEFIYSYIKPGYQKLFSLAIIGISLKLFYLIPRCYNHVLLAESALIGFSCGWIFNKETKVTFIKYLVNIVIALIGGVGIYYLSKYFDKHISSKASITITYFILGLWVSYGVEYFISKIKAI